MTDKQILTAIFAKEVKHVANFCRANSIKAKDVFRVWREYCAKK